MTNTRPTRGQLSPVDNRVTMMTAALKTLHKTECQLLSIQLLWLPFQMEVPVIPNSCIVGFNDPEWVGSSNIQSKRWILGESRIKMGGTIIQSSSLDCAWGTESGAHHSEGVGKQLGDY